MLYVFHGTDIAQAGTKARALITTLRAKRPDAAFEKLDGDSWDQAILESHFGGQGLFSNKYIVFLDRVTENAEAKEALPRFAEVMQGSDNIFIVLEAKPNAELKKALEKSAEKIVEAEPKAASASTKKEFNIFALADAVGNREVFKAWNVYRQAVDGGIEAENILGTLFWQAKSMALASGAKSAVEAGLSPFVYSKAKKNSANYSALELSRLVSDLIILYHDGHRGICDMELSVEHLLLNCGKS